MKKLIPFLLIIGGTLIILFSVWQIWQSNQMQASAIQEAKEKITSSSQKQQQEQDNAPEEMNFEDYQAEDGDVMGILKIPSLDRELPIIAGVDEDELKRGVGHYPGTAYPGQDSQVVLSGHRDTVFRKFGELEIGDRFIVEMEYGSFEYIIEESEIVSADDLTVINPDKYEDEMLTVTTCYPFRYIGDAPDRYILYAKPVETE